MIKKKGILGLLTLTFIIGNCFISTSQSFTEVTGTPFINTTFNTIDLIDIDSDGDLDLIQTGKNPVGGRVGKIYTNDGSGNFTLLPFNQIKAVLDSDVTWGDLNGDGTIDLIVSGSTTEAGSAHTRIYFNTGGVDSSIVFSQSDQLTYFYDSALAVADIDNDNDLDIMISGWTGSDRFTQLYTNNGSGIFSLVAGTPFTALNAGTINFSDVDNDNDMDVLIAGDTGPAQATELYLNDGAGNFMLATDSFIDIRNNDVEFADIDNDGDEDVLITGWNDNINERFTRLYKNNGLGIFTVHAITTFTPLSSSDIAFSDINNDGYLDVFICGNNNGSATQTDLYLNDGSGNFTLTSNSLTDVGNSTIAAGDIDGDGDSDVVFSGWADDIGNGTAGKVTKLFTNNFIVLSLEDELLNQFIIYPNPTKGKIIIDSKGKELDLIQFFDVSGRIIKSIDSNTKQIDISNLSAGSYFLRINSEGKSTVKKIVKI